MMHDLGSPDCRQIKNRILATPSNKYELKKERGIEPLKVPNDELKNHKLLNKKIIDKTLSNLGF